MLKSIHSRTKCFICIVAVVLFFILFIGFISRDNSLSNDNYNNNLPDEQELEPYYNLTAVDTDGDGNPDKNYTTPIKKQELGVCWSYAIMEAAETHIMVTNNETYQEGKTRVLSPRQLDYLNTNMINGYKNPYGMASFSTGGSFEYIEFNNYKYVIIYQNKKIWRNLIIMSIQLKDLLRVMVDLILKLLLLVVVVHQKIIMIILRKSLG